MFVNQYLNQRILKCCKNTTVEILQFQYSTDSEFKGEGLPACRDALIYQIASNTVSEGYASRG